MKQLKIEYISPNLLRPYERNARKHGEEDVEAIAASISAFGFDDPIGIWGDENTIVEGHGRVLAAQKLGLDKVPVIRLDHLTDAQRRAYALAHNRTAELSDWDFRLADDEIAELTGFDMSLFGFEYPKEEQSWFDREEKDGKKWQEGNDEYNAFVEKFEIKKTTDDCYTPENIYDAVADWVAKEYKVDREKFLRPFYPGGDYQNEKYPDGCVVVDNPPFSILAEITRWYLERKIPFFLFSPTLTLLSACVPGVCFITGTGVTFENGANVNISFRTNLEPETCIRTAPDLVEAISAAEKENTHSDTVLLKYDYPTNVITAAKVANWGEQAVEFSVPWTSAVKITGLDAMKEKMTTGNGIYGGGILLSTAQAAKAAQAAQAAKAAQAAGVPIEDINEDGAVVWKLSERELAIVAELDAREK